MKLRNASLSGELGRMGGSSSPKSHKSRYVDMSDQLTRTLSAQRARLLVQFGGTQPGVPVPKGVAQSSEVQLVFPNSVGRPTDPSGFRRGAWRRVFEVADVPLIRIHDMRHTFASLLLQQGESLHYVKEQMGHASIQTTVDVYGHLVPGANRNAVNKLDDDDKPELRIVTAVR